MVRVQGSPPRNLNARVAELVDALDLGSSSRKGVGVRVPSLAPIKRGYMKQLQTIGDSHWSKFIHIQAQENPSLKTILITIPHAFVESVYNQALISQQKDAGPYGHHQKVAPLNYIAHVYEAHVLKQVHEFLFKFFVISILHGQLRNQKIVMAGSPRIIDISNDNQNNAVYKFNATIFQPLEIQEWKYLPFKAPRRKRYKDLDRQVELFMEQEQKNAQEHESDKTTIRFDDWVNFDVALADQDGSVLLNGCVENLWLRIGQEEADTTFSDLFVGKKIGETFVTNNEGLQEYFNYETGSNFNFCVTIKDIEPHSHVCINRIKKQFRLKTNKELHQKLIEVFSFRNDISQRRSMVDETCRLILSKVPFSAPRHLTLRKEEELLAAVQVNPDYLVYKMQKDFRRTIEQLAERQVKETILIDQFSYHEKFDIDQDDVKNYLNLTKRQRTREFLHFRLPATKVRGQEVPISSEEIKQVCLREKMLNFIIYHLTKK